MCGIAGLASGRGPVDAGPLVEKSLRHRGPDAQAELRCATAAASWALVHTRLSIVDLSTAGEQPMTNEDGSLAMVFNGEIYNSPELRAYCEGKGHRFRSAMDGEVILHLWEMEGAACLSRLNGIFAVAVASRETGEVVLARDPVGVKPLFYTLDGHGSLWFASELGALAAAGAPMGGHDVVALAQFLSFLWVPEPRTPFIGAKALEPGWALHWAPDGVRVAAYRSPLVPSPEPEPLTAERALEEVRAHVLAAAERQLLADVPIGLMASGGVDSALIWWATHERLDRAYTIVWPGDDGNEGEERLSDDRSAVIQLETRYGTKVDYLDGDDADDVLPPSGDLFADPAYGLTRLIARAARERGHKVLFSGQGGDELLAGYRRHSVARLLPWLRFGSAGAALERVMSRLPVPAMGGEYAARLVRAAAQPDELAAYMQLCTYSSARERAQALDCTEEEVADEVVWQRHREVFDRLPRELTFLRRVMALDLNVYLPGLGLAYVDRAGMEFGVEIRVPWLDLELLRWTLSLPDSVLVRRGRGKWLTRELAAREISSDIGHRAKRAFAAPASRVRRDGEMGDRGFRQGSYFIRARRLLAEYLDAGPTKVAAKAAGSGCAHGMHGARNANPEG